MSTLVMANVKLPPPQKFVEDGEELENFLCTGGLKGKCETCYHWVTGHVGERWRVGGVVAFSATREREREEGWLEERASESKALHDTALVFLSG